MSSAPNVANLELATLKRYKKFYRLACDDERSRLVAAVQKHFNALMLDEAKVLSRFADSVKRRKMNGSSSWPVRK
ncbi:hypothetical protein FOA52_012290 [Chlamydomonas sp. UWO 241]|nr:hypothetical protein FOA52_012290 [Chlamydomonas sp. UWO 241]